MRRSSKWMLAGAFLLGSVAPTQTFAQCATGGCSTDSCFTATEPGRVFVDPGCSDSGCGMMEGCESGGLIRSCESSLSKCRDGLSGMAKSCRNGLSGLLDSCGDSGCSDSGCGIGGCDLGGCGEGCGAGGESAGGIQFGGWFQAGYHTQAVGLATEGVGGAAFNQRPDEVQLHQGYLYLEKIADGSNGLDWGFRADVLYGTDGPDAQSFGNPGGRWDNSNGFDHGRDYGWALPQAYLEIAQGDWSVIAGHFYTIVGYETVTAPDNFFYSHSLTSFNSEPFTHTGVLATYQASDSLELYGGWTAGWDTGFDQFGGGSTFLGGASIGLGDSSTLTYITTIGDFGSRSRFAPVSGITNPDPTGTDYSHSIVLDTQVNDKLNVVLQSDYVSRGAITPFAGGPFNGGDEDYGLNTYVLYSASEKVGYGMRAEWWRSSGVSFNAVTAGVNIKPTSNLTIRPEIRHDWIPAADIEENSFGIDAIISF